VPVPGDRGHVLAEHHFLGGRVEQIRHRGATAGNRVVRRQTACEKRTVGICIRFEKYFCTASITCPRNPVFRRHRETQLAARSPLAVRMEIVRGPRRHRTFGNRFMQSGVLIFFLGRPDGPSSKFELSFSQSRGNGKTPAVLASQERTLTHAASAPAKNQTRRSRGTSSRHVSSQECHARTVATSDRTRIVREPQRAVYDRELIYKIWTKAS